MNSKQRTLLFLAMPFLLFLIQCGPSDETKKLMENSQRLFGTIPDEMPGAENDSPELVTLGEKLYFDTKLSGNDTQSCNSCHNIANNGPGVDNQPVSPGAIAGRHGERNAPTVLNAGMHIAQFWDGRAPDLKAQAKGPVLNPVEMAMPSAAAVEKKLSEIEEYKALFAKAYPKEANPVTFDNVAGAIAAFERTLVTHDRFDDFQNGNANALTKEEQKGLQTFLDTGCATCHNGKLIGGNSYRKLGQANPMPGLTDEGRFKVTNEKSDMYVFKVPSLRNIALTYPYFHDGSQKTLQDAVKTMAYVQLGKELKESEIDSIVTFLKSLTGKSRIK